MEIRNDALVAELESFLGDYEKLTNAHDVNRWKEVVANDANYWFTEGSYEGIDAICEAAQRTFDEIQDETYTISDVRWVCVTPQLAVVRYRFHWVGLVDGEKREGTGRGTNAMVKRDDRWQMLHEHLSV